MHKELHTLLRGPAPPGCFAPLATTRCAVEDSMQGSVIDLKYSLLIEPTEGPASFHFYSPNLSGFIGVGLSVEDCLYKATWGTEQHLSFLRAEPHQELASVSTPLSAGV